MKGRLAGQRIAAAGAVFDAFLRLGCTSFGGPVAHIGYFRNAFVTRRGWLSEAEFADLLALCQFLPGPASSQLGMAIGLLRAGPLGMAAAWVGFTLPSALAMILVALGIGAVGDLGHSGGLHGLKLVAVAVVAQAVWGMARALCPDRMRATLAVAAAIAVLAVPSAFGQIVAIVAGGLAGLFILERPAMPADVPMPWSSGISRPVAAGLLTAFAALLAALPVMAASGGTVAAFGAFYRAGALVFGGGHVVLPLLQASTVVPGWIGADSFLAGYGAAQAVPGPLFSFAAYLGTAMDRPGGVAGGLVALVAIFLPSFLLVPGALPFWGALRHRAGVQAALRGVNAAVVGLLLAALYTPIWAGAAVSPAGFGLVATAFLLLVAWRVPPWVVVAAGAAAGAVLLPTV